MDPSTAVAKSNPRRALAGDTAIAPITDTVSRCPPSPPITGGRPTRPHERVEERARLVDADEVAPVGGDLFRMAG